MTQRRQDGKDERQTSTCGSDARRLLLPRNPLKQNPMTLPLCDASAATGEKIPSFGSEPTVSETVAWFALYTGTSAPLIWKISRKYRLPRSSSDSVIFSIGVPVATAIQRVCCVKIPTVHVCILQPYRQALLQQRSSAAL